MKKLILFSLVSLSVSSSFAAVNLLCNHGNFSPMVVAVQLNGSKALLKVVKSADAKNSATPQAGEGGVLTPQEGAKGWTVLATDEDAQGRGFGLNFVTSDLSKQSFRAVLSATETDYSTMVWSQYEMTCVRK